MANRRKRGDGSIHLRKDGRWEGRYVVGRSEKGLPITKNVLAKTQAECAKKAFDRELQFFMNECIQISRKCRISFVRNPQNSVKVFDKWGNVKYSKLQFGNRTLTER